MKRVNIFLNNEEKQKMNQIKKTHNLSFSTITDIIIKSYDTFKWYKDDIKNHADSIVCLTKNRKKTTIKLKPYITNQYNDKTINMYLLYYIHKMDKELQITEIPREVIEKSRQSTKQMINKLFQTTIDEWSNYNAFCRMKERYQRENQ